MTVIEALDAARVSRKQEEEIFHDAKRRNEELVIKCGEKMLEEGRIMKAMEEDEAKIAELEDKIDRKKSENAN